MSSHYVEPKIVPQPIGSRFRKIVQFDFLQGVGADWLPPVIAVFVIGALAYFVAV